MARLTGKAVCKAIGNPHLSLYQGKGYWYFVYDDMDATGRYGDRSVMEMYLNNAPLSFWMNEGQQLVAEIESKPPMTTPKMFKKEK